VNNAVQPEGAAIREQFRSLSEALPRFQPGAMPADARAYLQYYGLDVGCDFPAVEHSFGYCVSGEHRLAVHCWRLPQAPGTIYLVHGYFDHVGLYRHLVWHALERGFSVVAFDLPGHGLSTGPRAEISDFSEYRQAIADVLACTDFLAGRRHVIAQSTGGAAMMDFLQQEAPAFEGVVLLAPLVRPAGWAVVKLLHVLLHNVLDEVPRRFAENSQDPEFLAFLRQDPLQHDNVPVCWVGALRRWMKDFLVRPPSNRPLLVMQGDDDGTVDWRYNLRQIRRLFPRAEIGMLPGGKHHLVNESEALRAELLHRVDAYLERAD
jgi:lysophospholipase